MSRSSQASGGKEASNKQSNDASMELYSEIDTNPYGGSSASKEELYVDIDDVTPSQSTVSQSSARLQTPSAAAADGGYEQVEFGDKDKGEQTDSGGYAIVKELLSNNTATSKDSTTEEEAYYSKCEPVLDTAPTTSSASQPAAASAGASAGDNDDYAVVSFKEPPMAGRGDSQSIQDNVAKQASGQAGGQTNGQAGGQAGGQTGRQAGGQAGRQAGRQASRPFQKYQRKEHLYQEIDEVRNDKKKNPPDKEN